MMTIKEFKEWFDQQFLVLLEEKINSSYTDSNYPPIKKVLSYISSYTSGGKRLRPYLAYVGYTTEGGEEEVFPLYAAIEFLHLFCLIHDDIIDTNTQRRDVMTIHAYFENTYDSAAMGRAVALLVGDLVLAWAYDCLEEVEIIEPYTIDDTSAQFHYAVTEVIQGQLFDVVSQKERAVSKEYIEKKMELKSARYSFFQPLYMGMLLSGADEELKPFVEEYAINLGMAFQLQDDINDRYEDIAAGQQTLISWFMNHEASDNNKKAFEEYNNKSWSVDDEKKLQNLLENSGALSYAEHQVESYFLAAEDAIFNYDKTGEEIWQEVITEVRNMS